MKKIAITGGIASGKTTVCSILKEYGAYTLNSDKIVHQLLLNDPICIDQVINLLGSKIITDGKIDRKKVAEIVFNDEKKLKDLERILHPRLLDRIEEKFKKVSQDTSYKFFVVEIPLVQEIGMQRNFDLIVVIDADEKAAIKRFTDKGFTIDSYKKRMRRQWKVSKKIKQADYVIKNNGTIQELEKNVLELFKEISS